MLPRTKPERPCPRCGSAKLERLLRLRAYNLPHEWFRCEECDHLFTVAFAARELSFADRRAG